MPFPFTVQPLFYCIVAASTLSTFAFAHPETQPQAAVIAQDSIAPAVKEGEEPSLLEQAALVEAQPPITLKIQFDNNKARVEQAFYPEIEKLAVYLKDNQNSTVIIEGHTDNRGAANYNQIISQKRAQAIADVLVNTFHISEKRVSAIGYGAEKPLFNNDTAQHRKANRRVIAVISSNKI